MSSGATGSRWGKEVGAIPFGSLVALTRKRRAEQEGASSGRRSPVSASSRRSGRTWGVSGRLSSPAPRARRRSNRSTRQAPRPGSAARFVTSRSKARQAEAGTRRSACGGRRASGTCSGRPQQNGGRSRDRHDDGRELLARSVGSGGRAVGHRPGRGSRPLGPRPGRTGRRVGARPRRTRGRACGSVRSRELRPRPRARPGPARTHRCSSRRRNRCVLARRLHGVRAARSPRDQGVPAVQCRPRWTRSRRGGCDARCRVGDGGRRPRRGAACGARRNRPLRRRVPIVSPDPKGRGATRAMEAALEDAGADRREIGYLSAHGTGTPATTARSRRRPSALREERPADRLDQGHHRPGRSGQCPRSRRVRAGAPGADRTAHVELPGPIRSATGTRCRTRPRTGAGRRRQQRLCLRRRQRVAHPRAAG